MSAFGVGVSRKPTVLNNQILLRLPEEELARLMPRLETFDLACRDVLFEPDSEIAYAHFMNSGAASLVAVTENGSSVELGIVGDEGMVGSPVLMGSNRLPYRGMVQICGQSLRMRGEALKHELEHQGKLRDLLLRHAHSLHVQICQSAVCNRFHSLEQRICRWLLSTRDRVKVENFPLTQEFLACMLGSTRVAVTVAMGILQRSGKVSYRRGGITILDEKGLQAASCECYRIIRREYLRLYSTE
jgi:CRP-like cAMP-binding protein